MRICLAGRLGRVSLYGGPRFGVFWFDHGLLVGPRHWSGRAHRRTRSPGAATNPEPGARTTFNAVTAAPVRAGGAPCPYLAARKRRSSQPTVPPSAPRAPPAQLQVPDAPVGKPSQGPKRTTHPPRPRAPTL
ncbi:hypothetical protein NDU88_005476 [Pleurodeles waltl]|uniref:Uncharacterized protein n=1 Tax=Pleurodeles waltl TaxID=8319 RepID=A0AAV7WX54_PLEWA|nr:hypothetical protein NDU88_005476 [Pleurodeles waltl]